MRVIVSVSACLLADDLMNDFRWIDFVYLILYLMLTFAGGHGYNHSVNFCLFLTNTIFFQNKHWSDKWVRSENF